jgi:hypothetical protein
MNSSFLSPEIFFLMALVQRVRRFSSFIVAHDENIKTWELSAPTDGKLV